MHFRSICTTFVSMIMNYDVLVIGGGHAGCEAACASANMGAKTCLVTMDMNKIAQMSCNPAVGGIAKGQIVREIDALGGQMGLVTDATAIQFRMLNRSKGPAMWSPRAQCDRGKFIWEWRRVLDHTDNLDIWQDQADELLVESVTAAQQQTKQVVGVKTIWGVESLRAKVCHRDGRNFPQRLDAHRTENGTRWSYRRAGSAPFHREYYPSWGTLRAYEDRNPCAHRQTLRSLRGFGDTGGGA